MNIEQTIEEHINQIREYYHHLHANPEISFQEQKTAAYIYTQLSAMGMEVHQLPQNAIIGVLPGNSHKKSVGLRAELDALPITEATGMPFASKNAGVMHACGHDLHMTIALGLALILSKKDRSQIGDIVFVFQHAEEKIPGGAGDVLKSSFFQSHKPNVMLALHSFPDLKAGEIGLRGGSYMASGDEIDIIINGPGGHAALPHKTIDTVLVASHVIVGLQQICSRFIPTHIPAVLTFGNIEANSVMNIIPKRVKIEGTFRIMNEEWRSKSLQQIKKLAKGIAESAGAQCTGEIRNGYPSIFNNPEITRQATDALKEIFAAKHIHELPLRMTTDDFGYYAQTIPSLYFRLGVAKTNGECAGLHTPEFMPEFSAVSTGIQSLYTIINKLTE
ncbi:MAG: M20 family metallopeptidase [Salinivirgaceae bacterium]|jgi:amidohydrolase|nr:M20 family metallopeptidase [Salinivirgaceae bacterium]